jgi:hypothetical protein
MHILLRRPKAACLAIAFAAIWMTATGSARAGDGGEDAGSLFMLLCTSYASTLFHIPCPQYPTYANTVTVTPISPPSPIVLELAAWQDLTPDTVRQDDFDCALLAGSPSFIFCPQLAVNATNPPANTALSPIFGVGPPGALAGLASLAFVSNPAPMVPLTVTQSTDPKATNYVYAVAEGANGQPDKLDLFFETLFSGNGNASVSFPLALLAKNAATENSVFATLQIPPPCFVLVGCQAATVSVDLGTGMGKKSYRPQDLGIILNYFIGSSANISTAHPIYEVQVPLLVNPKTDPFYFLGPTPGWAMQQCPNGINQISGYCNAFSQLNPPNGFAPKFLNNTVVGMAPSAAPQCPGPQPAPIGTTACPAQTDPTTAPIPPVFGFCASSSNQLAAAFFLAIGPGGNTYISSPVSPPPPGGGQYPTCPS